MALGCGFLAACEDPSVQHPGPVSRPGSPAVFADPVGDRGLDFVHFNGRSGELLLAEITCGGGAVLDIDDDGDLDLYLLQGRMLGPGKTLRDSIVRPKHEGPLTDRLYRNDLEPGEGDSGRGGRWTDITADLGFKPSRYGCAAAAGDYDGDGRIDLYLANLGPNQLLRNLGGGRFEDVTAVAGVGDEGSGVVALFFDYDRDGVLDLFVGNNMAFDLSGKVVCRSLTGARDYCGPGAYPSQPDRLYRGRGDGTFEDVTAASGLGSALPVPTLGAVSGDFNGDGWADLYVANDGQPNRLWIQREGGRFEDRALLSGVAVNGSGAAEASMGVAAGDFDGDGDADLFLTHLIKETNTLYRNDGGALFRDLTARVELAAASLPFTSFGTGWLDFDNDGWLDLFVANGAVTQVPALVEAKDPFPLHQRNQLFRNGGEVDGSIRFRELPAAEAGLPFERSEVSRGAIFGDLDNDGDPDVVVLNNAGPARILLNQVGSRAPWVGLRLTVGSPPRDALGATVRLLRQGSPDLWRRLATDGSYGVANDPRILFGLSGGDRLKALYVDWPDGTQEEFAAPAVGRYTTIHQGSGVPVGSGDP